jgi:hypothetical protein
VPGSAERCASQVGLPRQPGYSKRLRKAAELVRHVTRTLARDTTLWSDDVRVVDSTPVECGRMAGRMRMPGALQRVFVY